MTYMFILKCALKLVEEIILINCNVRYSACVTCNDWITDADGSGRDQI